MFTVDRETLTHYPYYLEHQGPGAYPVFGFRLLDRALAADVLRRWAARQTTWRPSWLVMAPDVALKLASGTEPVLSRPPVGFYRAQACSGPVDGTNIVLVASDSRRDAAMGFRAAPLARASGRGLHPVRVL